MVARGYFRSGKGHGPAEVGSEQKILDGWPMRKSGSFSTKEEAYQSAYRLRKDGYRVKVLKGRIKWNVWRTYHRMKFMLKG
jgi:hypothetical protein